MEEVFLPRPSHPWGSIFEVGGAEVCRIAGTGYPIGTPKKDSEEWSSEWFYIEDAPLFEPVRKGLPEYSDAPLKKRLNWRPKSPYQEESSEVQCLAAKVRVLAHGGLTMVDVMAAAIERCVQPLQQRTHPLWHYNGTSDASRYKRQGPDNQAAMAAILADLFKGKEKEFARPRNWKGYSGYNPIEWVSSKFCT